MSNTGRSGSKGIKKTKQKQPKMIWHDVTLPGVGVKRMVISEEQLAAADEGDIKAQAQIRFRCHVAACRPIDEPWPTLRKRINESEDQSGPVEPGAKKRGRPRKDQLEQPVTV